MGVDNLKQQTKKTKNNLPNWIIKEKNRQRVKETILGKEIIEKHGFVYLKFEDKLKLYRYDHQLGYWKIIHPLEIQSVVTDELEAYNVYSMGNKKKTYDYIKSTMKPVDKKEIVYQLSEERTRLNNFNNCVYDVLSGERREHERLYYFLSTHGYNLPEVKGSTEQTNKWFNESFGINAQFMKEYIGYCFHKTYEPFQKFVILLGSGGNGKSTFSNYLTKLIGSDEVSNVNLNRLSDNNDRFSKSRLIGKSINIGGEVSAKFLKDTDEIKALTGDDKANVESKGQDGIDVMLHAKLLFACNELPPFRDDSGFERRICIVKMNTIEDFKTKYSMKAIESEIGSFALECMEAYRQAYNRKKLSITKNMEKERDAWLTENNNVLQFINECCISDPKTEEGGNDLFLTYETFCADFEYTRIGRMKFGKELEKLGFKKDKHVISSSGKRTTGYIGIRLKTESKTPKETSLT